MIWFICKDLRSFSFVLIMQWQMNGKQPQNTKRISYYQMKLNRWSLIQNPCILQWLANRTICRFDALPNDVGVNSHPYKCQKDYVWSWLFLFLFSFFTNARMLACLDSGVQLHFLWYCIYTGTLLPRYRSKNCP
jgi:hypothetical protein